VALMMNILPQVVQLIALNVESRDAHVHVEQNVAEKISEQMAGPAKEVETVHGRTYTN